jgi:hypothetical protein
MKEYTLFENRVGLIKQEDSIYPNDKLSDTLYPNNHLEKKIFNKIANKKPKLLGKLERKSIS